MAISLASYKPRYELNPVGQILFNIGVSVSIIRHHIPLPAASVARCAASGVTIANLNRNLCSPIVGGCELAMNVVKRNHRLILRAIISK
jgi:hypothetical protein